MLIAIIFFIILVTPFIIFYLLVSRHGNKTDLITKQKMELFAKEYKLNFESDSEIKAEEKKETFQLFKDGINRKISNYAFGEYKNYPVEIYTYKHRLEGGNSWSEYLILELNTKKILPNCIIAATHHINFNDDFMSFTYPSDLLTESNEFNYYYNIYINYGNNSKEDILEILTPDLMALFIDQYKINKNKNILIDYIEMNINKFIICKRITYLDASALSLTGTAGTLNIMSYFQHPNIINNEEDFKTLLVTGFELLKKIEK